MGIGSPHTGQSLPCVSAVGAHVDPVEVTRVDAQVVEEMEGLGDVGEHCGTSWREGQPNLPFDSLP